MLRRGLFASTCIALFLVLGSSVAVRAGLITNGDFSQYTAGATVPDNHYIAHIGNGNSAVNGALDGMGTLTGWTVYNGNKTDNTDAAVAYALLFSTTTQSFLRQPVAAPPDGTTTFLGLRGDNGVAPGTNSIQQTINGLSVGQQYTVSFDWAASQYTGAGGPYGISTEVVLGDSAGQSTKVVHENDGTTSAWMHESFTFTADHTSEVLKFLSAGTVITGPPSILLTNIDMELHAVPEPSTLVTLGLGAIGFVTIGLRRRALALKAACKT